MTHLQLLVLPPLPPTCWDARQGPLSWKALGLLHVPEPTTPGANAAKDLNCFLPAVTPSSCLSAVTHPPVCLLWLRSSCLL